MEEQKTAYIKFFASVNPDTANMLMNVVDGKFKAGFQKIVLLISSPGGSVHHGLSIYNYLKGLSIEIETHNFGSVDSIGLMLYCAGSKRYSVKNARFLMHKAAISFQNAELKDDNLKEFLKSLEADQENINSVIATATGNKLNTISKLITNGTTLLPQDAKKINLVHEIKEELIPFGADLTSINSQ